MSGVQCVGGLFSFSLSLKANLTGVHASFLFYCSALQASAQSQVLHLTQAHSFKFTFTVSLANDRELMSCGLSDARMSVMGPPTSSGPNPSLGILGLLQLEQETH